MPLYLVLAALLCLGRACSSCPLRCECSEAALTVKCVSKELQNVPTQIPEFTRNLFIIGNNINLIGPDSFPPSNIRTLSLSNNRISEIESHSFSSLRSLKVLDLSGNQLVLIHPEAFLVPGLVLQELNLSRSLYNDSVMSDLSVSLRWSGLQGLQNLDLSGNHLLNIPQGTFSHLRDLRRLQLHNNSLLTLQNHMFSGLENLQELDLSQNALKNLGPESLRELEQVPSAGLFLGQNPYSCSCGIEAFSSWLNCSGERVLDLERVLCMFPAGLRNVSVLAVGGVELGCFQVGEPENLALQTSYVFLGVVLGFVGLMFLLVLYLNRNGIKKRIYDLRDACREVWEGYHYRYEIDSDPRVSHVSNSAHI
ncbi:trophoblast glycoprotein a isoform X2 [Hoplias malabaricus]|uniref:trophoblast glycoprotein a isoform X2 n=1 Tax=Hoplias malabaricus TaxID=27720 RepID=UPI003461C2B9